MTSLRAKQWIDDKLGSLLIAILKPMALALGFLLRRDHGLSVQGDIVVIKLLGGGSLVLALPALLSLRRAHPSRRLSLVCTRGTKAFAETLGVFDDYIVVDDGGARALLVSGLRALTRCWRVDTVIDLEVHSRLSTVFGCLTCARNRIGFYLDTAFWRRGVATHLFFYNRASASHVHYEQIARALGGTIAPMAEVRAAYRTANGLPAARSPQSPATRIGLGCFCSDLSVERMLSAQEWARILAGRLGEEKVTLHLFGGKQDRPAADRFIALLSQALPTAEFVNECGAHDLTGSLRLLDRMDRFYSIDSGLLHIARLIGVETVSFWGPTDPQTLLLPLPEGSTDEVHYSRLACSPCVHLTEVPPCRGNNICMHAHLDPSLADEPPIWVIR
ncbi:glycosyltransferase family 9 protein [Thalassobaculum sp. OXR-137]|uniref:glycosyltransferase family 9 protein n=1 Tax=Thalassobaculum sp. OXR-137 TaxID=3100173 RepID=UPI002AC9649D|nr:glycosyltransferase family 9 protein [Thalassobaculum sp. OXR-137]WPZ32639.1 glycosyltransferase family 9 protein [Thalassobaculum sp. OXR-137]